MSPSPTDMLRLLGSGVQGSVDRPASRPVEESGFKELLNKARAGGVPSGIEARVADGVAMTFSPEQMKRLTIAGDKAEAAGASRAMILMDGLALTMDVGTRTIIQATNATSVGVVGDVDAVLSADSQADSPAHDSGTRLLKALAPGDDQRAA